LKIALLTQILPYPPNAGPRVKTWNVLRHLIDRGHEVTLISYMREEERQYLSVLQEMCFSVIPVPMQRSRLGDAFFLLKSLLSGRPFLIERDDLPGMRRAVAGLLDQGEIEALHMDQVTMTQFGSEIKGNDKRVLQVFDAHNATWKILDRMRQNSSWWMQPILALEARKMQRYEAATLRRCDRTLVVTEVDRKELGKLVSEGSTMDRLVVMPIAVDTERLKTVNRASGSQTVITFGTLHYAPNAEGIRWFLQEAWPQVLARFPEAELIIAGANPPADFERHAADPENRVEVTGYVEDLEPYLERAAVMVVPVLSGSGMRVRILEALSRAMPVVSTSIGIEGIDARHGEHLIVADDPETFGRGVADLIEDHALQDRLTRNARRLATSRYDWRVALQPLDRIYPVPLPD
jgi:glycosyltransferase involved in cell wall biosynthesis